MDVQGEAVAGRQRPSSISEDSSGQMSPHRMGSIVRKGNKARAMQRVDGSDNAVAAPAAGAGIGAGATDYPSTRSKRSLSFS